MAKNRGIAAVIIMGFFLLAVLPKLVAASPGVSVMVNGRLLSMPRPAVANLGITYVPVRAIAEALGAVVDWDQATQTVTVTTWRTQTQQDYLGPGGPTEYGTFTAISGRQAQVYAGQGGQAYVDNGVTMVPVRFVSEELGLRVDWDQASSTVTVSDQSKVDWVELSDRPAVSQATGQSKVDWVALEKRLAPYVYKISTPEGGSGTAWLGSDVGVVTAYHIVRDIRANDVIKTSDLRGLSQTSFFGIKSTIALQRIDGKGKTLNARIDSIHATPAYDIATLGLSTPGSFDDKFLEVDYYTGSEYLRSGPPRGNPPAVGDTVLILGNPRDLWDAGNHPGPISSLGKVLTVDMPFTVQGIWGQIKHGIRIQADLAPGSSGSPVFNSGGEVVGMVVAGAIPEWDAEAGVNRVVVYAVMLSSL